jgi:hypothetical protein
VFAARAKHRYNSAVRAQFLLFAAQLGVAGGTTMLPEIVEQNALLPPISDDPEMADVVLSKDSFDDMLEVIENPPELPEYLLVIASWYNDLTK